MEVPVAKNSPQPVDHHDLLPEAGWSKAREMSDAAHLPTSAKKGESTSMLLVNSSNPIPREAPSESCLPRAQGGSIPGQGGVPGVPTFHGAAGRGGGSGPRQDGDGRGDRLGEGPAESRRGSGEVLRVWV